MSRALLITLICDVVLCALPHAAAAQPSEPQTPTITVVATGSVEYVPDIARITLGIRSEAPTAASAVDMVNKTAAGVIAAVERSGINQRSIKTSGYNLEYREPQSQVAAPINQAPSPPSSMVPPRPGAYVASELLQVTAPVKSAGGVLDAAISAGANASYGLTYQSSSADGLYRAALAKAVQSARDTAVAIAAAAHVSIAGIQSISNVQERPGFGPEPMVGRAMAAAPVLPGTDVVTATISVVYRIR